MSNRRLSFTINNNESSKEIASSLYELKEVYNTIRYDWPQILKADSNPIEMAISLLDDTSVGMAHKLQEFRILKENAEIALKNVVEEHYQLFNNSVGSYHMLLNTLRESQQDSIEIKKFLENSNKEIHDRSSLLRDLSQSSAKYSHMIEILDAMDEINNIPTLVDQLIIDKKIHEVYDVISNGYKAAEKYKLWSLSAMSGIKDYLEQQSNRLFDMIIEELQNEIYLKNSRAKSINENNIDNSIFSWDNLINNNNSQLSSFTALLKSLNLEQYIYNSANLDISETVDFLNSPVQDFINYQLPKLHSNNSQKNSSIHYNLLLEATSNASTESFYYIYMLLSTASKLSKLDQVYEVLTDTTQADLHELINRTTEEVKLRNGQALSKLSTKQYFESDSLFDILTHGNFTDSNVVILQELFGSIFLKSLAVLQRHEIVNRIINLIEGKQVLESNRNSRLSENHVQNGQVQSINNIWNIVRKELKTLMLNYIYDERLFDVSFSNDERNKDQIEIDKKSSEWYNIFQFKDVDYDLTSKNSKEILEVLQDVFPGFNLADNNSSRPTGSDGIGAKLSQAGKDIYATSTASIKVSVVEKLRDNWSFLENGRTTLNYTNRHDPIHNNTYVALNSESIPKFNEIINTFESIRDRTILALRYELRYKILYYTKLSCLQVNWIPVAEDKDADQFIIQLSQEICDADNKLAEFIDESTRELIFNGLGIYINDLIVKSSFDIKKINSNGIKRLLLNISTFREMLKSLSTNVGLIDFTSSSVYFEMFLLNEFNLLNRIKINDKNFSKQEYENLARLIYSEKLADGKGSQFNKSKYNDLLKKIDELF
ncbi:unnamed protein product [Candida verbasci]|uniref:Exocyst complex component Sec8 n=1 Tax=Candida verbasci TaxID=1227364 RepID=A0A9W4TYA2_9ASCO|nr:unnamed protein product [Candida verbasci]